MSYTLNGTFVYEEKGPGDDLHFQKLGGKSFWHGCDYGGAFSSNSNNSISKRSGMSWNTLV